MSINASLHVTEKSNKCIAAGFIEDIWNNNRLERLPLYLDSDYKDHSLPFASVQNANGFIRYLRKLNESITHRTIIEYLVAEHDMVYVQFTMEAEISLPCSEANHYFMTICGCRYFKIKDQKITDHWEIIESVIEDLKT